MYICFTRGHIHVYMFYKHYLVYSCTQFLFFRTPVGTREFEISAHTYLDSHRAEMDINHWMIVMGVPGDEIYPVVPNDSNAQPQSS